MGTVGAAECSYSTARRNHAADRIRRNMLCRCLLSTDEWRADCPDVSLVHTASVATKPAFRDTADRPRVGNVR